LIDRISGRASFRRFDGARRRRTGLFTLVVAEPPSADGPPALAFAVARRIGGAVVRNRIRRRLRAVFAELDRRGELPRRWYLVVVHPPAVHADHQALHGAVVEALRRVTDVDR
jgi:ribonuclease P protein component